MRVLVLIIFSFVIKITLAQANGIEGNWLTLDGERKITIYKTDNKYFGKIIWVKDQKKSNEIGKVVIKNLEADGDDYENGTFIMPADKHNASCSAKVKSGKVLQVSIYHGLRIFGHNLYLSKLN
jgi:uncharacterized protein (DUF2147 family)